MPSARASGVPAPSARASSEPAVQPPAPSVGARPAPPTASVVVTTPAPAPPAPPRSEPSDDVSAGVTADTNINVVKKPGADERLNPAVHAVPTVGIGSVSTSSIASSARVAWGSSSPRATRR